MLRRAVGPWCTVMRLYTGLFSSLQSRSGKVSAYHGGSTVQSHQQWRWLQCYHRCPYPCPPHHSSPVITDNSFISRTVSRLGLVQPPATWSQYRRQRDSSNLNFNNLRLGFNDTFWDDEKEETFNLLSCWTDVNLQHQKVWFWLLVPEHLWRLGHLLRQAGPSRPCQQSAFFFFSLNLIGFQTSRVDAEHENATSLS